LSRAREHFDAATGRAPAPRFSWAIAPQIYPFFAAAVCLALVSDAAFDAWFYYRDYRNLLFAIQRAQADDWAARINQAFGEIESQIGWIAAEGFDQ
jgi:hypothetical protein